MIRHRLTDEQWKTIADLFPATRGTGRPPRDRRTIVDVVLWNSRTDSPWRDVPADFSSSQMVWRLFDQWNQEGTLDSILKRLRLSKVDLGEIDDQLWRIDGTIVRAATCAAGGSQQRIRRSRTTTPSAAPVAV